VKRISVVIGMLVLAFGSSFIANADDALVLDKSTFNDEAADANSMAWPMLPGESVSDLARLFYPKNSAMQQQFVAKTLRLNAAAQLKASQRFDAPTLLQVPTLKSLSKIAAKASKKPSNKALKMSYGLKRTIQLAPEKLLQEYNELISKNAFLKEQLIKLNEKIVVLQAKLDDLKLIFDKTLTLPNSNLPIANQSIPMDVVPAQASTPESSAPVAEPAASQAPAKKVFKNLSKVDKPEVVLDAPVEASFLDRFNMDILKIVLAVAALLLLGALVLKKYRQRMFEQLSFTATKMQNTVTDFSGYFEKTKQVKVEAGPETIQHQQAVKEVEVKLNSTLEEAKLLMSVNRSTDAIAHLKMTIESQPRASINHWLYLLEVFRKLNLKDEFEQYANRLHQTYNVMTPVWYEKEAEVSTVMIVPQSIEEFPHIMEQLYGVWPGELAGVYLRSLITDNRGGERLGFGKEVVNEIVFLIELLDSHKDVPN
jgi:hypothetical protein